jgi:glycosyltransferase involved in cell wall biosynthesis
MAHDFAVTNREGRRPIRLLTFSSLFPNAAQPNHGVFVENRLRHLVASGEAVSTVLAPVPWFPFSHPRFGAWARFATAPARELRHGLDIRHPRYVVIPRFGMTLAPRLLFAASLRAARRLMAEGFDFDLIDAHYVYPDGVAAVLLGRRLGKPVVITGRGSDLTQLPDFPAPRRNGVDTKIFHEVDCDAARRSFGVTRPAIVSVGGLIERKGHHRTIEAMQSLPEAELLIAGEGPERRNLETLAARLGVADRVRLLGPIAHAELKALYSAADVSVLASSREGWANVLLESMACGTPVVASAIPGNPEVVQGRAAGLIVANTPEAIAAGVRDLLADPPARAATRAYAERMSWDETTAGQLDLFRRVLGRPAAGAAVRRAA